MDDKLYRDIFHLVGHLVIYSFAIWNFILGLWLIIRWTNKNWKRTEQQPSQIVQQPSQPTTVSPVINIDGSEIGREIVRTQKATGPVEVDVERKINLNPAKGKNIKLKTDEIIKGKVKTQKNKLKELRGKSGKK